MNFSIQNIVQGCELFGCKCLKLNCLFFLCRKSISRSFSFNGILPALIIMTKDLNYLHILLIPVCRFVH